jgi:hypothetical protein
MRSCALIAAASIPLSCAAPRGRDAGRAKV